MFIFNIFLASLTYFSFKKAFGILGHNVITVGGGYKNGLPKDIYLSDNSIQIYSVFLFFLGAVFLIALLWSSKKQSQEGQYEDEKGLRNIVAIVVSLLVTFMTPLFIMIAMFQDQVSGMFYGMIFALLMVELYFGRASSKTLMISLILLYLGAGTAYTFIFNGAVIFLIVAVASRLMRSLYGEPVVRDSISD